MKKFTSRFKLYVGNLSTHTHTHTHTHTQLYLNPPPLSGASSSSSLTEVPAAEENGSESPRLSRNIEVSKRSWGGGVKEEGGGEEGGEKRHISHGGNHLLTSQSVFFLQVSLWTPEQERHLSPSQPLFTCSSVTIIWGMQPRAVQV